MSNRENIANNIITVLDAVTSPIELKKITREPFDVDELTNNNIRQYLYNRVMRLDQIKP